MLKQELQVLIPHHLSLSFQHVPAPSGKLQEGPTRVARVAARSIFLYQSKLEFFKRQQSEYR
jgi:hypothetical protein